MNHAVQITEDLTVIGQVRVEQLHQAVEVGFQSVLNLRSPDELGFWQDEGQVAENLGLQYLNMPLKLELLDEVTVTEILGCLDQLPKPVLIHCAAGMRSTAIALLKAAVKQGLTPEQTVEKARSLGFHYIDCTMVHPQLRQRFFDYINKYAQAMAIAA